MKRCVLLALIAAVFSGCVVPPPDNSDRDNYRPYTPRSPAAVSDGASGSGEPQRCPTCTGNGRTPCPDTQQLLAAKCFNGRKCAGCATFAIAALGGSDLYQRSGHTLNPANCPQATACETCYGATMVMCPTCLGGGRVVARN